MTVATVSGRYLKYEHVWLKCAVKDLSKEYQEAIKAKLPAEEPGKNSYYNYFVAQGQNIVDGKRIVEQLLIDKKEAEKILKKINRPCVWVEDGDPKNKQFWISWTPLDKEELRWFNWSNLGREEEVDEPDEFIQWLVNEFYARGGLEGALKFVEEKLAVTKIPQLSDYGKQEETGGPWGEETSREESKYLDDVKDTVDLIRNYERAQQLLNSWGKYWRIVHAPVDNPAVDNNVDKDGRLTLSGVSLKTWLDYHLISQTKAAEICGVSSRTFRRWIAGKPPIPKGMLELLQSKVARD